MGEIDTKGFGDFAKDTAVEPKRRGRPKGSKNAGSPEPVVVKSGLVLAITLAQAADLLTGDSRITAKIVKKNADGAVEEVSYGDTEFYGVRFAAELNAESLTDRDRDFPTVYPIQAHWNGRNLNYAQLSRGAKALGKLESRLENLISQAGDPSNLGDWLLRFANNVGVNEVSFSTEPGVFYPTKEVRVKINQFVAALKADTLAAADEPVKVAAKSADPEAA